MVITKILEGVLVAGQTSISFTDSDISNSLIRTYSTDDDLYPVSRTIAGNILTITYEAQSTNKAIAVEIVKEGLEIVDNVTSTDTDKALSANQGKILKDSIITSLSGLNDVNINTPEDDDILIYDNDEWINTPMPSIPENISDLDDVSISSITDGQVLAWDSDTEKFVNVNQSGSDSSMFFPDDNTPVVVGKYGTRDIYRKRIYLASISSGSNNIGSQLPNFDVLIDWHGYVKTSGTNPRYMSINSDINAANWWCGMLTYGLNSPPVGDLWAGSQFAGGSAEVWIDYVPPVP